MSTKLRLRSLCWREISRTVKRLIHQWAVLPVMDLLISDRLGKGHTIVEQKWSYEDFCDITIRLDDYTYALNRQVEVIALVRSFRPIPVDEFDRIARPLIM